MPRILLSLALAAALGLPAWAQSQPQGQTPPADPQQSSTPSSQPPADASAGQDKAASEDQGQQDQSAQPQPKKTKKQRLKDKFSSGCVAGVGCWGNDDKDKDRDKGAAKPDAGQQPGPGQVPPSTPSPGESSSRETKIDLSPPPSASEAAGRPTDTVHEMVRYDPHAAAKDNEVGDLYRRQGNCRGAISRYRDALDNKPNDALATFHMAECYEKLGEVEQAGAFYQSYLKILPRGAFAAAAREGLGRTLPLLGGRRPQARSEQGEAALWLGERYFMLTNYPGAEERFRYVLALDPDDSMAHMHLAQALEKMGNRAEAEQNYQAYLRLLPRGPFAADVRKELNKLGTMQAEKGPAQPPDVTPELEAGESALESGNYAAAEASFRKALAADPSNPRAVFRMAQALEGTGKRAEALAEYHLYLKVDPNGPYSLDALRALDRLAAPAAETTSPPAGTPPSRR